MNMKCGVVTFPGSNCDEDMVHVLAAMGATAPVDRRQALLF